MKKHVASAAPHSPPVAGFNASPPRRGAGDRNRRSGAGRSSRIDEERYQLVCQAVAEGIYEWSVETNALSVSARLIEIFGLEESGLSAADWNRLVHPEDFPRYRAALRDCFKGTTTRLHCEYRVRHSGGTYRWVEDRGIPVRNEAGRAIRLVGALTDVTERKATEEALRETLAQQTATAEVLQAINASPGDLAPVFDAMLEKAMRLCEAAFGGLWVFEGDRYVAAALRGVPTAYAEVLGTMTMIPGPGSAPYRFLHGEREVIQNIDLKAEELYRAGHPQRRALVDLGGARTAMRVPLCRDDAVLGVITIYRQEVRPFSDKQMTLLQNFAAQAVIAMENARLITETREALEQQTATAEVLGVINASPGDLAPVFDAILEKAHALCGAALGTLFLYDGAKFRAAATHGYPDQVAQQLRHGIDPRVDTTAFTPLIEGARLVTYADLRELDDPLARVVSGPGGVRTNLLLPLRKDDVLLGMISCNRLEVRPYTDKEIALLENFAVQAVIAMENARLLGELRERTRDLQESLECQTATSEVLQAISRSTFDLQRVLETLAESAAALAQSDTVFIFRREGETVRLVAQHSPTPAFGAAIGSLTLGPDRSSTTGRALLTGAVVRITNVQKEPGYALRQSELDRIGSTMAVPLLRGGETVGVITLARLRVEPYLDRHVDLVRTFADQAVIAIENTRLLTELRESLEQQQAMAEVLGVINSNPGNLQPVFDAILEKAHTLGGATRGRLWLFDGEVFRTAASQGYTDGPLGPPPATRFRKTHASPRSPPASG